jgi:hypothetical protein
MDLGINGVKDDNYRWRDSCRLRSYCKSQKEEQKKKNKRVSHLGLVVDGRNGESVPHFAASTPLYAGHKSLSCSTAPSEEIYLRGRGLALLC